MIDEPVRPRCSPRSSAFGSAQTLIALQWRDASADSTGSLTVPPGTVTAEAIERECDPFSPLGEAPRAVDGAEARVQCSVEEEAPSRYCVALCAERDDWVVEVRAVLKEPEWADAPWQPATASVQAPGLEPLQSVQCATRLARIVPGAIWLPELRCPPHPTSASDSVLGGGILFEHCSN